LETPEGDLSRNVKSHTREQISCLGPDGLLRRHDYTVDILGGATGLNYYQIVKEPLLTAIDMGEITLL
jgi:hypothetical protein